MEILELLEAGATADNQAAGVEFKKKLKAILALDKQPRSTLAQTQVLIKQLDFNFVSSIKTQTATHLPKLARKATVVAVISIFCNILTQHALLLKPDLDKWNKQHSHWHRALHKIYTDVELYSAELQQLLGKIRHWRDWAENNLFFLPPFPARPQEYCLEFVLTTFRPYYGSKLHPVPKVIMQHLTEAKKLARQVPNARFNELYPRFSMPCVPLSSDVPPCNLCDTPAVLQVLCNTCKDKVVCWNCVRQTIWSAHHDENRVFREPREVHCSFCRSPLDLSHLLKGSVQLAKRLNPESADDAVAPPAKRQMLEQPNPCEAPVE